MPFSKKSDARSHVTAALKKSSSVVNLHSSRAISELESQQVHDLRTIVPKLNVDNAYILRWLRSKEGRFDETAEGLKKNVVFRKAWDLDRIDRWVAPEVFFQNLKSNGLFGF